MRKNSEHFDEYSNHIVEFVLATGEERKLGNGAYPQYSPKGDKVLFLARETPDYPVGPRKAYTLDTVQREKVRRVAAQVRQGDAGAVHGGWTGALEWPRARCPETLAGGFKRDDAARPTRR